MNTLAPEAPAVLAVQAVSVRFTDTMVYILLTDHREIGLPLNLRDLRWLAHATPEQQNNWTLGPGGRCVLWNDLNDGIEVEHLFRHNPLI